MNKFTIEDLRDIVYRGSYDDLERELALQLLASMEQEPVGYYRLAEDGVSYFLSSPDKQRDGTIPLYAAPQLPQPVPDSVANTFIAAIEKEQDRLHGEDYLMDSRDCIDVIREELQRLNACRAACYISCRYL